MAVYTWLRATALYTDLKVLVEAASWKCVHDSYAQSSEILTCKAVRKQMLAW